MDACKVEAEYIEIRLRLHFCERSQPPAKKARQGRATKEQLETMVDYFVINPHVAIGKFISLQGKADLQGSWEELASQLNAMSKSGKEKDVASWKTVSIYLQIIEHVILQK